MTVSPFTTVVGASRWYADNPLATFRPSPALAPFMTDEARRILIRAANRVGKTKHAAARLARVMLTHPGRKYRVVGTDFKQTAQVAGGYLAQFLPRNMLAPGTRFTEARGWNYDLISLINGTTCEFRTYEQSADQHAGPDLDGVWGDEPPPIPIYVESTRRVFSKRGFYWLTFTPSGREVGWLRKIVEAEKSPWRQYIAEMSAVNCPWYTEEQIDEWIEEARQTPDSFRQTIYGDWEGITGDRTFTGYDSGCHFTAETVIPKGVRWGVGVDHGEGAGKQVAILIAWTGKGKDARIWIVDEHVSKEVTGPEKDAEGIVKMLGRNSLTVQDVALWKGDINTAGKGAAGKSANQLLSEHLAVAAGYRRFPGEFEAADKGADSLANGVRLVNTALLTGHALVRADRCPTLCRSLAHHSKKKTKADEDLKHPLDGLRYIAVPALDPGDGLPTLGSWSPGLSY